MEESPWAGESDEQLVGKMAAAQQEALLELHRRYARLLYALGRRMLADEESTDICVQDAFYAAWQHATRFDPARARAKTWLVAIAHHRFLQELRDRPRPTLDWEDVEGSDLEEGRAGSGAGPPALVDQVLAQRALARLAAGQRELVELMYFRGHTHAELAALTGLPLGTVKSRLRAALEQMRRELQTRRFSSGPAHAGGSLERGQPEEEQP